MYENELATMPESGFQWCSYHNTGLRVKNNHKETRLSVAQMAFFYSELLRSSLLVLFFSGANNLMYNINGLVVNSFIGK